MTKDEILDRLDAHERDPNDPRYCDAPCDAAEYLGLNEGEYLLSWLRNQIKHGKDHDYSKCRSMRVVLPGGAIETSESCGCNTIYHGDGVARVQLCRGHGGGRSFTYEHSADMDPDRPCCCGWVHRHPDA